VAVFTHEIYDFYTLVREWKWLRIE
jgi:hypothetical protein